MAETYSYWKYNFHKKEYFQSHWAAFNKIYNIKLVKKLIFQFILDRGNTYVLFPNKHRVV